VAHLDDEERALVLGLLLEETLAWVRTLKGTSRLRALIVFDEVYGYLPPHPANPPTKRPLVALMKQARAFGVGVVVATQNPMDLDYRALSNAGVWSLGRLQTDADRERVIDGITNSVVGAGVAAAEVRDVVDAGADDAGGGAGGGGKEERGGAQRGWPAWETSGGGQSPIDYFIRGHRSRAGAAVLRAHDRRLRRPRCLFERARYVCMHT
jgi:hypothetical protein